MPLRVATRPRIRAFALQRPRAIATRGDSVADVASFQSVRVGFCGRLARQPPSFLTAAAVRDNSVLESARVSAFKDSACTFRLALSGCVQDRIQTFSERRAERGRHGEVVALLIGRRMAVVTVEQVDAPVQIANDIALEGRIQFAPDPRILFQGIKRDSADVEIGRSTVEGEPLEQGVCSC
jgi:hypothetical protein